LKLKGFEDILPRKSVFLTLVIIKRFRSRTRTALS